MRQGLLARHSRDRRDDRGPDSGGAKHGGRAARLSVSGALRRVRGDAICGLASTSALD